MSGDWNFPIVRDPIVLNFYTPVRILMLADDDMFDVGDDLVAGFLDLRHRASLAGTAAVGGCRVGGLRGCG